MKKLITIKTYSNRYARRGNKQEIEGSDPLKTRQGWDVRLTRGIRPELF